MRASPRAALCRTHTCARATRAQCSRGGGGVVRLGWFWRPGRSRCWKRRI